MNARGAASRWLPRLALCAALAAQWLPAQGGADEQQEQVSRLVRQLQNKRSEVDRLLEQRMRHDLGLPGDELPPPGPLEPPVTAEGMEQLRREMREEDARTAALLERFGKLSAAVAQLKADADAAARRDQEQRTMIEVPVAGAAVPDALQRRLSAAAKPRAGADDGAAPAPAPAGETATRDKVATLVGLEPLRAHIHGSDDHQRVAQALFKAGQALMDHGEQLRRQGDDELARELDERAKERLERALAELEPLLEQPQPPFAALFYRGRCRELLFRYAERHEGLSLANAPRDYQRREQEVREPFLAIAARDVTKGGQRGEIDLLGQWGQAAQAAMEHFRWMNLHAGYDALPAIERLTWPGEHGQ